ncbi:MAG: TetR/AcrR family transcriptional regulator [Moritella sp.]|uniref:TetR/AcrR family transcriptional regulator n=1 Tax=Moritella sp. TaxID=78556 RepID=UPI001DF7FE73|nr:TetR/AcrR family transcriptional regulator [Moritella sp.]NQZ51852.1 TetR/AcrR family transcriptional regulator [Moritella sp.]
MATLNKKQETRKRIINAASRGFRSNGYAGIGVDGIAKEAGVTSGAFYAHLGSKGGAFEAALSMGLDEVITAIPEFQRQHGKQWIVAFSEYYLGQVHRDNLACGCAMTTLSPEVVRTKPELHVIYEAKMLNIVELMARGIDGSSDEECLSRAWAVLGILIGGLTMARAVASVNTADNIASAITNAAINAAGQTKALAALEIKVS